MARNTIQFQKGLSLPEFHRQYGQEHQCWRVVFQLRYPCGFQCSSCRGNRYHKIKRGALVQCASCNQQYSLRAGTLMQHSKLPFKVWFLAMYLISQNKKSISALALARHCGISYNSAWLIKQKIMHAFLQAEQHNPLAGVVHVDDGYLGGKRQGIRGRGAHGKTPFITALSLVNGRPAQLKLSIVPSFTRSSIGKWAQTALSGPCTVYSDSLSGFAGLKSDEITHKAVNISANPDAKDQLFQAINTIMGNLKRYLLGIHHAIRVDNLARYLAAFAWRFNHRYDLKQAFRDGLNYIKATRPLTLKSVGHVLCT